jgi:hypothetical protein
LAPADQGPPTAKTKACRTTATHQPAEPPHRRPHASVRPPRSHPGY